MNACAIGSAELALQIQQAGETWLRIGACTRLPVGLHLACRVFVGKAQSGHLHLDALALVLHLPAHAGVQQIQRHIGLLEHAGEAHHGALHLGSLDQRGLSLVLIKLETAAQPLNPWHTYAVRPLFRRLGAQAQLLQLARCLVALQLLQRPTPGEPDLLELATGLQRLQLFQHGRRQRQALRQLGGNAQVQPIGLQFTMLAAAALFLRASGEIAQAKIPSRPVQAVAGGEFQPLHGKRIAIAPAAAQPPFQLLQRQRLRPVLPLHGKCLNRHIGHCAYRLATLHIYPGAHSPLALLQLPALRGQVLGQLGQVNMRKVKKGPATPAVHPPCVH